MALKIKFTLLSNFPWVTYMYCFLLPYLLCVFFSGCLTRTNKRACFTLSDYLSVITMFHNFVINYNKINCRVNIVRIARKTTNLTISLITLNEISYMSTFNNYGLRIWETVFSIFKVSLSHVLRTRK